jgi:hypothetical protein
MIEIEVEMDSDVIAAEAASSAVSSFYPVDPYSVICKM